MPLQFGPRLQAFLNEPLPIVLGTTRRDGGIEMNPVWFEYREGQIWLNGGPKRDWFLHMKRDPRVTLLLLDAKNMFRWVRIVATLAGSSLEDGDEHIERLSQRYTGGPYRNRKIDRMVIRVDPVSIGGFESGQAWDVT